MSGMSGGSIIKIGCSESDVTRPPEFTDDALALRFAEAHSDGLRYVAALGKWFLWDGSRWCPDETLVARDLARRICREASSECNEHKASKMIASAKTIAAVERLAQADRKIAATVDQWDADPWLVNTPAGTVNLKTGVMRSHDPKDHITKITGAAPDADCPIDNWLRFLLRVCDGKPELMDYLQRIAGYSLTGSTQEHALFFLYGLGANGKSTFINALTSAAGDYHKTAPIETFTASNTDRHPTDLAALRGARLVTAVETEEGRRWAESKVKALTGGDKISARFMRQDFFEYVPQFKLILAGNHRPGLRSIDEAIRRRFNLVPFAVSISPEERDEKLPEKLSAEMPGILAWMIAGCLDWLSGGLRPPHMVTAATRDYLESEDAISAWMDENCVRDANHWEKTSDLFTSWTLWADTTGEFIGTQKRFIQNLESRGLTYERTKSARGFRGVRLRQSPMVTRGDASPGLSIHARAGRR